jgi:hypothetical protein
MFIFVFGEGGGDVNTIKSMYHPLFSQPMFVPLNTFPLTEDVEPALHNMGFVREAWFYYRDHIMVQVLKRGVGQGQEVVFVEGGGGFGTIISKVITGYMFCNVFFCPQTIPHQLGVIYGG